MNADTSAYVVLDTDIWSELFAARGRGDEDRWRPALVGKTLVIATQTRAEVLAGLAEGRLGERRSTQILHQLDQTPTVPVTEDVVSAYARLTAECKTTGHGLHAKVHTGDRWVAATAIAIGAVLAARDRIYRAAPRVRLLRPHGDSA